MKIEQLKQFVQEIVKEAKELKDKHTDQINAPVNYACIFSQSQEEYEKLQQLTSKFGKVIKETKSGPLFQIEPLETVAGILKILKIRNPDLTKPEKGDADFTVEDYPKFKEEVLNKEGFKLIEREYMEMIELTDKEFNVRVYFSHPPLDKQFKL